VADRVLEIAVVLANDVSDIQRGDPSLRDDLDLCATSAGVGAKL
jgi:hypothetical protein